MRFYQFLTKIIILLILMRTSKDNFFIQQPTKILEKAELYSKTISYRQELPKSPTKSIAVKRLAQTRKEDIDFSIKQSKYQMDLFRRQEQNDQSFRQKVHQKILSAAHKVESNEDTIAKKKAKEAQNYEQHLKQTYKRFEEDQTKHRLNQKQQSYKLRKQIKQFYDKEDRLKKESQLRQISAKSCYQSAVDRLNKINQKNQEFSTRTNLKLNNDLNKNSHFDQIIHNKIRSLSMINRKKNKIYEQSLSILNERENNFIQKYGNNQSSSIEAWKHIEEDCFKQKKRIGQFFKQRNQKWSELKKRVDQQNQSVPEKCSNLIQKSNKSSFRNTMSTFRSTVKQWQNLVHKHKSQIKQASDAKADTTMNFHLDLRLKNVSSSRVNEKMESMRQQAKKIAFQYS